MRTTKTLLSLAVRRFFEGEDPTKNPAPIPVPIVVEPPKTGRVYTENEFNTLLNSKLAEEKRKGTEANRATVVKLQELQQQSSLTQQQKDELEIQIQDLQNTYRTAEETKKLEIDKLTEKAAKKEKELSGDRDNWKARFERNMISVDISRASVKYDAVSPEQIEAFLNPITRVTEQLDEAGKPTGKFITKVKFEDTDAEGKRIELDLDTDAAVKLMRDRVNRFGNLFKNSTNGGTGTVVNSNPTMTGKLDIERMGLDEYKKHRASIRQQMSAQNK